MVHGWNEGKYAVLKHVPNYNPEEVKLLSLGSKK